MSDKEEVLTQEQYPDQHHDHGTCPQQVELNVVPVCVRNLCQEPPQRLHSAESDELFDCFADEIVPIENVTVKFFIGDKNVVAQVYPNRMSVMDIKKDLARKFEVPLDEVVIIQNNRPLSDECLLMETCNNEFGIHEFKLERRCPCPCMAEKQLNVELYYSKYRLSDFITVHISGEDTKNGQPKDVVVKIRNQAIPKPFLCGYKDRVTGLEYHDAFTQTGPEYDKCKYPSYTSRDTQTYEYRERLVDTMHDQTSQCFLDGNNVHYVSAATDYYITPGKYQTYAQKMRAERRLEKIRVIQRNWRAFLMWRGIQRLAREYRRLVANRVMLEKKCVEDVQLQIKREERAKQFPRTKDDFDLLYAEVQKWKMAELKRIASLYEGPSRIAEVNILLDKEIQLRNGIERQRRLMIDAQREFRNEQMLKKLGEPITWIGYKDKIIHLDLLRTQRARFLTEVYKDLQKPLEKEARVELLKKVCLILEKEQDFPHYADMVDLFEREKNLLIYTKFCDVEVLRKRQNLMFLDFIKYSKDKAPEREPSRMCKDCKRVKKDSQFAIDIRHNEMNTCKKCYDLKSVPSANIIYGAILRSIQREERKKRCNSSYAFILPVDGIRYIIDKIWHGHSILSKKDDLSDLRLPRWIKSEEWSPWNCVCLTSCEARDHYNIDDLEKVYNKKIMLRVHNRHLLARNVFQKMAAVATGFMETGEWWQVGLNRQRTSKLSEPIVRDNNFPKPQQPDTTCHIKTPCLPTIGLQKKPKQHSVGTQ